MANAEACAVGRSQAQEPVQQQRLAASVHPEHRNNVEGRLKLGEILHALFDELKRVESLLLSRDYVEQGNWTECCMPKAPE